MTTAGFLSFSIKLLCLRWYSGCFFGGNDVDLRRKEIRVEKLASSLMSPEALCFSGGLSVNCLLIILYIS